MRFLLAILLLLIASPAWAQQGQGMSQAVVVSSCGGGALPAGVVNQLTMNPQGQLCLVGISGGGACSQATAYLARTTGGNEGGNAANITTLICGLVTDGVWSNLDALYLLAQQNVADAKLNLVGTSYALSANTATFTTYQGYSRFDLNAGVGGIDTGFNATTAPSPKFTLNSAAIGAWSYDTPSTSSVSIGASTGTNATIVIASFSGNSYCEINVGDASVLRTPPAAGLIGCDRPSSSTVSFYFNGASAASGSVTSAGLNTNDIFVGSSAASLPTTSTVSEAHFGASLGSAGNLALYNRLRTYMTAIGVP